MADRPAGRDAALAARNAREFAAGMNETAFLDSPLHQSAVIRQLEIIGEAASRVSARLRAELPQIPWAEIIGMRHRLVHDYFEVRLDIVWRVVEDRLDPLIETLTSLVPGPDIPEG